MSYDGFVRDRLPPPEALPEFLFELPELQYPERLNAAVELIDRGDPDALAVINAAGQWTYGDMKSLSDRIARVLVEQEGLVPGNRVLLRGPNGAMLFAAWLGVLKAGGIVVATMPILRTFGLYAALGVGLAFVVGLVLVPLSLSLVRDDRLHAGPPADPGTGDHPGGRGD